MTVTQIAYPSAPTVTAIKGTLLDIAVTSPEFAWHDGRALYESYNCMNFTAEAEFCPPSDVAKDFDQAAGWIDGFRFAVYGGLKCRAVGLDQADMKQQAERVFAAKESVGVERGFMRTRFVAGGTYDDGADQNWEAPTDLTPGTGAVSASVGIGMLESHAASIYAGVPVLHMPRLIANLMALKGAITLDGNVFRTSLGTPVAAGGGYDLPNTGPDGSDAPAGEKWLYATGTPMVSSSDVISIQSLAMVNSGDTDVLAANDVLLLVERAYIGSVDCYAAAVRVKVE